MTGSTVVGWRLAGAVLAGGLVAGLIAYRMTGGARAIAENRTGLSVGHADPMAVRTERELCGVKRLREIESRVLPSPLVAGPRRYDTLPEYYWTANPELLGRLRRAKAAYDRGPRSSFCAVTLVAGAAGVGKTFLKKEVVATHAAADALCKFDIGELYDSWVQEGIAVERADLASGDVVLSRLKSIADKRRPRVRQYLEAHEAAFYVIDSLDEIHPDDYTWVLKQVEDFAAHCDRRFVHVVVFGRGFAFRDFWAECAEDRATVDVALYLLHPPVFRTTGDLLVSSWNYHSWKYHLAWSPEGEAAGPMPLDDYARWAASGFSHDGPFRSVTCDDNDDIRADVQTALVDSATQHRLICGALYNLAGNGIIREIERRQAMEHQPYDAHRIAEAYLHAWLRRETKAHDRPSSQRPERLDLYLDLLAQVAVQSLQQRRIDDRGFFPVAEDETVAATYRGRSYAFATRTVLDRSGLIVTDPRDTAVARYRFEPFWMHRLLVEMRCEHPGGELQVTSSSATSP